MADNNTGAFNGDHISVTERTTDFMWINTSCGLSLLKFKGEICHTVFDRPDYQIFHDSNGNYVYDKRIDKVYTLTIDNWTRLVLKLASLLLP